MKKIENFLLLGKTIFSPVFSNSPCRETPKYALKKRTHVRTFFGELAQMYVGLSLIFFSAAPRLDAGCWVLPAHPGCWQRAVVLVPGALQSI
jgi:hypothetical protein